MWSVKLEPDAIKHINWRSLKRELMKIEQSEKQKLNHTYDTALNIDGTNVHVWFQFKENKVLHLLKTQPKKRKGKRLRDW
jgi:hypothetical protein